MLFANGPIFVKYSQKLSAIVFGSETVLSFNVNDCVMLDLSLVLPISWCPRDFPTLLRYSVLHAHDDFKSPLLIHGSLMMRCEGIFTCLIGAISSTIWFIFSIK